MVIIIFFVEQVQAEMYAQLRVNLSLEAKNVVFWKKNYSRGRYRAIFSFRSIQNISGNYIFDFKCVCQVESRFEHVTLFISSRRRIKVC